MWLTDTNGMIKLILIEIWFLAIALFLFFSIAGGKRNKKNSYSWEKKNGASISWVIISLVSLIGLAIYVGVYLYDANNIRF